VDALDGLTKLTHLNLKDCFYIYVPPKTNIMTTREEVIEYQDKIRLVMALRDEDTDVLSDYKGITKLDLDNCDSLENVDGLVRFSRLANLKLSGDSLSVPPAEKEMDTRKQVAEYQDKIRIFMALRDGNTSLINDYKDNTSIDLSSCKSLKNVDVLANCTSLADLNLSSCESLENVNGLAKCTNLTKLDLSYCESLQNVDGLKNCTKLTSLNLESCYELQNIGGLANCTKLTSLNLSSCDSLKNVDVLANCTNLANLDMSMCSSLQNVYGLSNLASLSSLDLSGWNGESLKNLKGLSNCTFLTSLNLSDCRSLQNLDGLDSCTNLTNLNLSYCNSLQNVNGLAGLVNLASLDLSTCRSLRPKPSPDIMTTRSQVKAYQLKVMKKAGMEIPESFGNAIPSGKANKHSIDRKTLAKIKKFLKSRDYNHIDSGIELVRSMDDPSIYEVILDACSIDSEGKFARSSLFTGTGPAQPYLDYALLNLIAYAPEDCNLGESLKLSNIESLNFDLETAWGWAELPSCISCFSNLLSLNLGSFRNLQNLDGLSKFANLTSLVLYDCRSLQNADELVNLANLTSLKLTDCKTIVKPRNSVMSTREEVIEYQDKTRFVMALRDGNAEILSYYNGISSIDLSYCNSLQNLDGLSKFANLTSLDLTFCKSLQNVDGLVNCTNLTSLELSFCDSLQNVDGLANCTNLTNLKLYSCESLQNVDGLVNCTNLTSLELRSCDSLQNVDGLVNCTKLTVLDLSFCRSLNNVDGLVNFTKLTVLNLGYSDSLLNVDGLANCTKLTNLNLSDCRSLNVDGLASCTSLNCLNLSNCHVTPEPTLDTMENRDQVADYQEKFKISMK
jgi:Leucine-rich repeat (LRR) protein